MATNPLLQMIMSRLAQQSQGGMPPSGGPPPGMPGMAPPSGPTFPPGGGTAPPPGMSALDAAQSAAQTPYGKELGQFRQMRTELGAMVNRFLQRDPTISRHIVNMYKTIEDVMELIEELPAAPVMGAPPGMPSMGGPASMGPFEPSPYA